MPAGVSFMVHAKCSQNLLHLGALSVRLSEGSLVLRGLGGPRLIFTFFIVSNRGTF